MVIWGIVNVIMCCYIFFLLFTFWDSWHLDSCMYKLNVWLMVYLVIQGVHTVRTIILLIVWKKAKDPSFQQIRIEFFFGMWIFLFEAGWIIYGSTFIYS